MKDRTNYMKYKNSCVPRKDPGISYKLGPYFLVTHDKLQKLMIELYLTDLDHMHGTNQIFMKLFFPLSVSAAC